MVNTVKIYLIFLIALLNASGAQASSERAAGGDRAKVPMDLTTLKKFSKFFPHDPDLSSRIASGVHNHNLLPLNFPSFSQLKTIAQALAYTSESKIVNPPTSQPKANVEPISMKDLLSPTSGSRFVSIDQKFEEFFKIHEITDKEQKLRSLNADIQAAFKEAHSETIFAFRTRLPLETDTTASERTVAAASGAGGPSAASGDRGGYHWLFSLGFKQLSSQELFGDSYLAKVAENGYQFFSKSESLKSSSDEYFKEFQKSLNAQYMFMSDVVEGRVKFDEAAIPHVVMEDSEIGIVDFFKETSSIGIFFKSHSNAVGVLNVGKNMVSNKVLNLQSTELPRNIRNLIVTNISGNVTNIGHGFLSNNPFIRNIDLKLNNVKIISNYFLFNCRELKSIDFSSLVNLENIQDNFLLESPKARVFHLKSDIKLGRNFIYLDKEKDPTTPRFLNSGS